VTLVERTTTMSAGSSASACGKVSALSSASTTISWSA